MKLRFWKPEEERAFPQLSLSEYIAQTQFSYGGASYQLVPSQTMPPSKTEEVEASFAGYIRGIYKNNGPIYSCMAVGCVLLRPGSVLTDVRTPGELWEDRFPRGALAGWDNGDLLAG
jgi:hypothetical protein